MLTIAIISHRGFSHDVTTIMGVTCSRRSLTVWLHISIEPEEEPLPEPAAEAQGAPEPSEAAGENDFEDSTSSASWDFIAEPVPHLQVQLQQRRGYRANSDTQFHRTLQLPLVPVRQVPLHAQLVHRDWRYYIVWQVPGRADWSGIHYSHRALCWTQLRLQASAARPDLTPASAFKLIKWYRAYGCTLLQLEAAFRRESGQRAGSVNYFLWRY